MLSNGLFRAQRRCHSTTVAPKRRRYMFILSGAVLATVAYYGDYLQNLFWRTSLTLGAHKAGISLKCKSAKVNLVAGSVELEDLMVHRTDHDETNFNLCVKHLKVQQDCTAGVLHVLREIARTKLVQLDSVQIKGVAGTVEKNSIKPKDLEFVVNCVDLEDVVLSVFDSMSYAHLNTQLLKKEDTILLPEIKIDRFHTTGFDTRGGSSIYQFLSRTRGRGQIDGRAWSIEQNAQGRLNFHAQEIPIQFVAKYLVYPLNLVETAHLDVKFEVDHQKPAREAQSNDNSSKLSYKCKVTMSNITTKVVTETQGKMELKDLGKAIAETKFSEFLQQNSLELPLEWEERNLSEEELTPKRLAGDAGAAFVRQATESLVEGSLKRLSKIKTIGSAITRFTEQQH